MKTFYLPVFLFLIFCSCTRQPAFDQELIDQAIQNGRLANEAYVRSMNYVKGWLTKTDSASGLIPTNLTTKTDLWEPHNSAADNYAFMVLTTFLLDKELYKGEILDMLNSERKLTSRIKSLPNTYSFSKKAFNTEKPDMNWVIFGTAEYMKDGLIPLCEYIGESPWKDRMLEMLDDLPEYYTIFKDIDELGGYQVASEEVNGDMLQILVRTYWMTGKREFLDWAILIGDYYMLGERDLSSVKHLRLRDHGCEIIGGLSELYVSLNFVLPEKKKQYQEPLYRLLDRILEVGRNPDGLFYNAVNAETGEVINQGISDNWGYIFDAFYSVFLIDHTEKYRQAFLSILEKLNKDYRNFPWEGQGMDGYADAIEGGINLYNRESVPALKEWIDSEIKVMWNFQKEDGIIEGWHGDGNFARTSIMYGLWKTQGAFLQPWRDDLILGAEKKDGETVFALISENDWEGKLIFDSQRHKTHLNLPLDYPRINQYPEWFTAEEGKEYSLVSSKKKISGKISGKVLLEGINIKLKAGEIQFFAIKKK